MNIDIKLRLNQITSLQNYHKDVDKEVTMILQNLQWDRKHLAERKPTVACQYDINHRVPPDKLLEHENECFLKNCGYSKGEHFLPSPVDPDATTLVKLCADDIAKIINKAPYCQPLFRTVLIGSYGCDRMYLCVKSCGGHQPLTLERLQTTYTADERRAIYDAVVNQVPSCHDLSDLAFVSSQDDIRKETIARSKLEILAELRDMRRRRTKYRVAAKTRNYSDVLRDVISTQMELYNQAHNSTTQQHMNTNDSNSRSIVKGAPSEKNTRHYDNIPNRSYHSMENDISTSSKNTSNISLHSTQHDKYETRKREYNESNYIYGSRSPIRTERCKYNFDNKLNRRDVTGNSSNTLRKSHKHIDHYENRNRREEIEYDHKGKIRAKDNTKDRSYDNNNKYHSYERSLSNQRRKDHVQHRNTKLSHKDNYDVDRQKRYDYKRKQKQSSKIKKEKDDGYTDDSNSTSNETEYTDVTSHDYEKHYSDIKNIKKDGEVYLKKEGGDKDFHNKDHRTKPSDKFDYYKQSKISYRRHTSSKYRDKHKHGTNYNDIQQNRRETGKQKIKAEKEIRNN